MVGAGWGVNMPQPALSFKGCEMNVLILAIALLGADPKPGSCEQCFVAIEDLHPRLQKVIKENSPRAYTGKILAREIPGWRSMADNMEFHAKERAGQKVTRPQPSLWPMDPNAENPYCANGECTNGMCKSGKCGQTQVKNLPENIRKYMPKTKDGMVRGELIQYYQAKGLKEELAKKKEMK